MVDQSLDPGCNPGFDVHRYIPGLYGPREIVGVDRPVSTVDDSSSCWTNSTPVPGFDHASDLNASDFDSQEYLTPEYQEHLESLDR